MFLYKDSLGLFSVIEDIIKKQNLLSLLLLQLVQGWPIFSVKCLYYNTLTQIWHAVFAVNVKPPDSTSRCSATFQLPVGMPFI